MTTGSHAQAPPRRRRGRVVVAVVAVVVLAMVAGGVVLFTKVLPPRAVESAAKQAASRYLSLVAEGTESDLNELWGMSVGQTSASLRAAGELLVGAAERIKVVSVGDPEPASRGDDLVRFSALDEFRSVPAQISLGEQSVDWAILIGRLRGTTGEDAADWRVIESNSPSLDWSNIKADSLTRPFVSGQRQVRLPDAGNNAGEVLQPLYPARYRVKVQVGDLTASPELEIEVLERAPILVPPLETEPTPKAIAQLTRNLSEQINRCSENRPSCPARGIAAEAGARVNAANWWRGLETEPTVTLDEQLTFSGGVIQVRTPQGLRSIAFEGKAELGINTKRASFVADNIELVAVP